MVYRTRSNRGQQYALKRMAVNNEQDLHLAKQEIAITVSGEEYDMPPQGWVDISLWHKEEIWCCLIIFSYWFFSKGFLHMELKRKTWNVDSGIADNLSMLLKTFLTHKVLNLQVYKPHPSPHPFTQVYISTHTPSAGV